MMNQEKVHKLMKVLRDGKERASKVMGINPITKRLEVVSREEAERDGRLQIGPEDMKVSRRPL